MKTIFSGFGQQRQRRYGLAVRSKFSLATALLLLILAAIAIAACTHNPKPGRNVSAAGNKAEFCQFLADFKAAGDSANTPEEGLALFKSFEPRFDKAIADAPSSIRPAATAMIDAMRKAIRANDVSATDKLPTPEVESIDEAIDTVYDFCGIQRTPQE